MTLLLEGAVDISIVLLLALAVLPLLRRQSAAVRHCVLATALGAGAVVPLAEPLLPEWRVVPVPFGGRIELAASSFAMQERDSAPHEATAIAAAAPSAAAVTVGAVLVRVWATGAVLALAVLLFGFLRLRHLSRRAWPLYDPRLLTVLASVQTSLGIRRPVTLLESSDPRFLVVWGVLRPRVLLPPAARDWSDARLRLVLTHELAHVRRGDWVVQCAAELVRAVHWFNPLVWLACARLRREGDHACDDSVLMNGGDGSEYASHLVDVARALRGARAWLPAPAIAHTTGFERRVQAMLDAQLNRRPLTRRTLLVTLATCWLMALPIAALTAAQALVSFTGSVVDPSNAVLPDTVITLTNVETQAKYEVHTNREGRYAIPGLPSGRYLLESKVPGFEAVKLELTVGGQNVEHDLKLELGTIQETINIVAGSAWPGPPRPMTAEQQAKLEERLRKRAEQRCPDGPRASPAVGGNIRVPLKLRDRRPIYPPDLAASGVAGKVELEAVIDTDGSVRQITVKSATHSEFAASAMDAVRQWEFDATLLNCVPVETRMNVTANYVYR